MATKRDYRLLAKWKSEKSELETLIKEKEKKILADEGRLEKVSTEYGNLCLSKRENFSITDNSQIIDNIITQEVFNEHAKLAPGKLKELVGKLVFAKLVEEGLVVKGEDSIFYTLRQSKC